MNSIIYFYGLFFIGSFVYSKPFDKATCGYDSCHPVDPNKLNVHLVPHSHDDVGWLKTVDQYFYGRNISYQRAGVQYIIDSVVHALEEDPKRRFIQVETAFFWQWWKKQDEETRSTVRHLVNSGQLEIIGGAWSMNDEAAVNYQSVIDQFTLGLRTINDTLGECGRPKIGWQIDPFGHTREMASIFAQLGYDGVLFARLDYRDVNERQKGLNTELIWKGNPDLGETSDLFTSLIYRFYDAPATFCWDVLCGDEPIVEDEESPAYNVERRVNQFHDYILKQKVNYKTPNILITMGGDFTYQAAPMYYKNLDKLIKGFKRFKGDTINMIYSTPSCYIKAVNDYARSHNLDFERKTDDFIPYASDQHTYWTGYYTSRPNSKRFERQGNNLLQVTKQLVAFEKTNKKDFNGDITKLKEIMGIMQHHDAITGTEKQHVADDYVRLLTEAFKQAENNIDEIIYDLLQKDFSINKEKDNTKVHLQTCLLSNITHCEASNSKRFSIAVYNPLSRSVSHYVRLPVNSTKFEITGSGGELLDYQVLPSIDTFKYVQGIKPSLYDLVFYAKDLPPFGLKYYHVERLSVNVNKPNLIQPESGKYRLGDAESGFAINPSTGLLNSVTLNGETVPVKQQFMFYRGANGTNENAEKRASGAYIFRPAKDFPNAELIGDKAEVKVYTGDLVDEVHEKINDWVKQIIRIYKEENYIEFDWLVGPIEYRDKLGVEVVSRFITDLNSDNTFYTDTNGRGLIKRVRDYRPTFNYTNEEPVSGNYYPITSRIVLKDKERNLELAVLNDRAQGGSSLHNGELELMVHRRLINDDKFGVAEVLDEKEFGRGVTVRGQHQLVLGTSGKNAAAQQHDIAQRKLLAPWVFVGAASSQDHSLENFEKYFKFEFAGLTRSLPENVQILTLETWEDNSLLLRLEHLFESNEDPKLSEPVTVDLEGILSLYKITSIRETTLAGNQWLEENRRLDWNSKTRHSGRTLINNLPDDLKITLSPQQIRTFIIGVESNTI
ncbi:hypothetical protein ILUMI_22698 [Ignelater luminosus]|uniref:Alpha-mannosidase n=1 Tax=Ignelater luminosus TaxID=2038154 RepID=A0A8K0G2C5_IGNLU|nr:hypothetical protein ILUMI_22698 [Ignelater luminosus]